MKTPGDLADIRLRYLGHAVRRVQKLAAESKPKAWQAAEDVRRYLEEIADCLPEDARRQLCSELGRLLCGSAGRGQPESIAR